MGEVPLVVTAAVIQDKDKFLIAQRKKDCKLSSLWEFPGGKIEFMEHPEECLKREIKEEIDMEITHLLTCRDELQSDIEGFSNEPQIAAHIARIHELDQKLVLQKEIIFSHNADYQGWRERNKVPKSHWWWYMDK